MRQEPVGVKRDSMRAKLTVETRIPDTEELTSPLGGGVTSPTEAESLIFPLSPVRDSESREQQSRAAAEKKRVAGSGLPPQPFRFPLRQFAGGRDDDEHVFLADDEEPRGRGGGVKGLKSRMDSAPSMTLGDPAARPAADPLMSREGSTASLSKRQDSDSRLSSPVFGSISRTASNTDLRALIDTASTRHEGFECAMCRANPIVGIRYKCVACANFDLCASCEAKHTAALAAGAGVTSLLSPPASPMLSSLHSVSSTPSMSLSTPTAATASNCKHLFFIKVTWPLSLPFMLSGSSLEKTVSVCVDSC